MTIFSNSVGFFFIRLFLLLVSFAVWKPFKFPEASFVNYLALAPEKIESYSPLSPILFSRRFRVSGFVFKSLAHLEMVSVWSET